MRKAALLVAAAALLAGCGGVGFNGTGGGYASGDSLLTVVPQDERDDAPVLEGTTIDGEDFSTDDLAGKVVVVNVWGSWCPPCRKEAPVLAEVAKEYADRGVAFVGVNVRDQDAAARAFERKIGVDYPSISDADGSTLLGFAGSLPSQAIPTTWVIDADGRVAARKLDGITKLTLEGLLDDVLEER